MSKEKEKQIDVWYTYKQNEMEAGNLQHYTQGGNNQDLSYKMSTKPYKKS